MDVEGSVRLEGLVCNVVDAGVVVVLEDQDKEASLVVDSAHLEGLGKGAMAQVDSGQEDQDKEAMVLGNDLQEAQVASLE